MRNVNIYWPVCKFSRRDYPVPTKARGLASGCYAQRTLRLGGRIVFRMRAAFGKRQANDAKHDRARAEQTHRRQCFMEYPR
jgi:hypothetical protein